MPLEKRFKEWAWEYEKQGWKKGWEEGWRKGVREGASWVLERALTGRFGGLPQSVVDRINSSRDEEELIGWARRAVHARTLAEVFEDAPR
ncbi:hypothetical protein [Cupriavidus gilardii]|uniref:hypothetical protein n=1 Tax=Cupriavidus gilardii TaxID=82541 RepID=UPI0007E4418E|nr:hypothetical protein [Cupriavidus gilardii]